MSMQLANAGKEAIESNTKAHRDAIRSRGYGTHYGDRSGYKPPAGASLTESSCVVWAMECAGAAFKKVGQEAVWRNINRITRANQLKGTVLAQQLISLARWTGIYWNPDISDTGDRGEHSFSYSVAKKSKTYYKIPIQDYVLNYRPMGSSKTTKDETGLAKLAKVPFWVGCAGGGRHVFCGTGKKVSEFHWTSPATDTHAMELVSLQTYPWLSGIIVIPPTVWATASR